jgi:hypothetical protein
VITDPYDNDDDDDDSPTLQRPAAISMAALQASVDHVRDPVRVTEFLDEPSTDTDLVSLGVLDALADAHTVDALPPSDAVARMDDVECADMDTPRIPLDIAAVLLRASQDDDGRAH